MTEREQALAALTALELHQRFETDRFRVLCGRDYSVLQFYNLLSRPTVSAGGWIYILRAFQKNKALSPGIRLYILRSSLTEQESFNLFAQLIDLPLQFVDGRLQTPWGLVYKWGEYLLADLLNPQSDVYQKAVV